MILPVLQYPHAVLKAPAQPVRPSDPEVHALVRDMLDTMRHHNRCVGLAAPQVGKSWQVIVVDASRIDKPGSRHGELTLINPRIVHRSEGQLLREGCLSVPDFTGNVMRHQQVEVHGVDPGGHPRIIHAHGFEAIVFQHELDHLDGKLFLDRVSSLSTDVFRRKKYS